MVTTAESTSHDAFGQLSGDSEPSVGSLFLYTARPYDPNSDLQNNLNRWYDLSTGRWMSMDPIGFEAGDVNLYRYVVNQSTSGWDPTGLDMPPVPPYPTGGFTTPGGLKAGNLRGGLVARPTLVSGRNTIPWNLWLRDHGLHHDDQPIRFGCGGIVGIRADRRPPPHLKPGTKCTTVYADAIGCLAAEQNEGRWPLLIAVQFDTPGPPVRATPGCCDLDGLQDVGAVSTNFLSFLGLTKWESYWEGASGATTEPGAYVIETAFYDPFGYQQTFFCLVQNPYNWSPDVR